VKEKNRVQDPQTLIAEIIRSASREVRLIDRDDIEARCLRSFHSTDPKPDFAADLEAAIANNHDLSVLTDPESHKQYYSVNHMSRTYAGILARRKSPVAQIVETIRENSRLYPRPVPLDLFIEPPFDLLPEDIQTALTSMNGLPDFSDIAHTTTSSGTIYLYSTLHLEHEYARLLAERQDVGLAANP